MIEKERDRDYCFNLLKEYTKSDSLIKHALAVEACVLSYAKYFNEDISFWSNAALLHDFDYEKYPDEHPYKGAEILRELKFSEEFINTILSHASYTGVKRESKLAKTLFACDELAGFLTAVAYVRPNKTILEVEVKSVLKKMKDKAFAKNVSRDDIKLGAEELNIPLQQHIEFCISAMKDNHTILGL